MSQKQPRQASTDTDSLIGEVLANRYQIERRLGEGAMGVVYKARHVKMGRAFAVKVLHPRFLTDPKIAQRFEREAELAARLRHPNVIGVVDVGETSDGFRYMVMDFVEGPDLAALLSEAPMPPQRISHIIRQLLEGLYHAHEAGLIHRDFKPENVLVERDTHGAEVPRIVDFGISILREGGDAPDAPGRLTTNGLVLGTPHYMAPEQAVADPVDHRIDLFALGIVVYEMLSGKLPFDGSGAEVARANLMLDPPRISVRVPYLEVDPLLEAFARKLMAKSRTSRPPTAKAARELLDLIDRDRSAAAAALGVPIETGTRMPAQTAPVAAATRPEEDETARVAPPQAPPMAQAIAKTAFDAQPVDPRGTPLSPSARRPAPGEVVAIDSKPIVSFGDGRVDGHAATALDSDHLSSKMIAQEPPRRRGVWIVTSVAAVALAAIAIAVMLGHGDHPADEPPAPATAPVAVITPAKDPKPTPVVEEPAPAPQPAKEPPVDERPVTEPPVSETNPPPPAPDKVTSKVEQPTHPTRVVKKASTPPVSHAPMPPLPHPAPPPPEPVVTHTPSATTTPPVTEVKPAKPADATVEQPKVDSAVAVSKLYGQVGREFAKLRQVNADLADELYSRYRRIQIFDAMKTPDSRAAATSLLNDLHKRITAAMH